MVGIETSSDRSFVCFICCRWTAESVDARCPTCDFSLSGASCLRNSQIDAYTLQEYVGRGYYGATFRAVNRIDKRFALKLSPVQLYASQDKDFAAEIRRYRAVGNHRNIAELIDAGSVEVELAGRRLLCYYIVMEWVDGIELSKFAQQAEFSVTDMFMVSRDMLAGVARLERSNLWHNDLNANNILVSTVADDEFESYQLPTRYVAKIVDFGSAVFRQPGKHKPLDDVRFVAKHINTLRTALLDGSGQMSKDDRFFLLEVEKVIARALDEDPSRSISQASAMGEELATLYRNRPSLDELPTVRLDDPFSYLNANDFPNDEYVNVLFSGELPWLKAITSNDPQSVLITGPRGSGKTMILKSLRLRTRLTKRAPGETSDDIRRRIESDALAGFFVSARISIGNHCPLTKLPSWALDEISVSVLFNLLWAYEIVDTLALAVVRKVLSIEAASERNLCRFLGEAFRTNEVATWGSIASELVRRQREIIEGVRMGEGYAHGIGPAFLTELCSQLKTAVPVLRGKNLVFLLDDFSLPRVPREIQETLLPTIWNSGGGYTFRVTAHSESVSLVDKRGSNYVPNREFSEINLGASYVDNLDVDKKMEMIRSCVDDILNRRFALSAKYRDFSLERALGQSKPRDIAGEIRDRSEKKKLQGLRYAGWETIIRLCSGDIAYIIDVLRVILGSRSSSGLVSVVAQNRAIRNYARQQLYRLKDYSEAECNLYEVALNFGKFSKFKLIGRLVGSERRPAEYLRIEVETDHLAGSAKMALGALLRNGVFVDGGFSSSSQGSPARRLIFKKLFTPVFPTTYNNRDTWPMSAAHFRDFISNPEYFLRGILGEEGLSPDEQSRQIDMLIDPVLE